MLYARYVLKNHFYGVLEPIIFLLKFIYTPTQTPHGIYGLHKMRMCCTIVMVAHFIPFLADNADYHMIRPLWPRLPSLLRPPKPPILPILPKPPSPRRMPRLPALPRRKLHTFHAKPPPYPNYRACPP